MAAHYCSHFDCIVKEIHIGHLSHQKLNHLGMHGERQNHQSKPTVKVGCLKCLGKTNINLFIQCMLVDIALSNSCRSVCLGN
jgi:hypothetical protein